MCQESVILNLMTFFFVKVVFLTRVGSSVSPWVIQIQGVTVGGMGTFLYSYKDAPS